MSEFSFNVPYFIISFTVIAESLRKINRAVNNGYWHHICATWENTAGSWNFYIDGVLVVNGENVQKGHVIKNNGIVILGQDQDNYGCGFQQVQSFKGEIFGMNMWNKVLSSSEILHFVEKLLQ